MSLNFTSDAINIGQDGATINITGTVMAETPAAGTNSDQVATTAFVKAAISAIYPIGSIYMSVNSANPGTYFTGTTWTAWGSGKVPVGVDAADANFNAVEKTGGASTHTLDTTQIPSHTHTQSAHTHWVSGAANDDGNMSTSGTSNTQDYGLAADAGSYSSTDVMKAYGRYIGNQTAVNQNTGGGAAHNNLQPYITCYMFKRTA